MFILVSKNVCASYANAEDYDCSEYARYKCVKRSDFDANHRPESLCESRLAKKTYIVEIVVMIKKELEVLGFCATRYCAKLFCGPQRFSS